MNMADLAHKLLGQLKRPTRERFPLARLPRSHAGNHMRVARIKHDAKPRMSHFLDDSNDFRRLVEREAGLKFPYHVNAGIIRKRRASLPGLDYAPSRNVLRHLSENC